MSLNFFKKTASAKKSLNWRAGVLNLQWVIWLTALYFAANYLVVGIVILQQKFLPKLVMNQLVFAQTVTILVWATMVGLMVFLPKLFSRLAQKNCQLSKLNTETLVIEPKKLGFSGWLKWSDIGLGVAGFVLGMVARVILLIAIKQLVPGFDLEQQQDLGFSFSLNNNRLELWLVFVMLVILAPLVEEFIFRGYLYGKIRQQSGFLLTMLIVSLLFGIGHYSGGGWVTVAATFSLSVAMCLTREVSGSLYPSVIIHMINNGIAFAVLLNMG